MSLPRTTSTSTLTLTRRLPLLAGKPSSLSLSCYSQRSLLPSLLLKQNRTHQQYRTIQTTTSTSAIETNTTIPSYQPTVTPTPPPRISVDDLIASLPLVQTLRQNPTRYKESRPHLSMTPSLRPAHFVAGTLSGPEKVSVAPYMFTSLVNPTPATDGTTTGEAMAAAEGEGEKEGSASRPRAQIISIFHIGEQMCGHPGYVHGGLLSVMFDEAFARCVSDSFPSGLGMTANLNVDFRKPAIPDRVYVLRAETVRVEGRKAWVEGTMKCLPSGSSRKGAEGETVVAEARALFVEPKFADSMVPLYRN